MTGNELINRLRALAKERNVYFQYIPEKGKGSHCVILFDENRSVIPYAKRELKKGTLHVILKQLGLTLTEIS